MALQSKPRAATYADIEALPANMVGEIIFGVLHTHPRPAPRHAKAQYSIQLELGVPFERGRGGPGGWVFLPEPELHLADEVIVPDIAGWRRDTLPRLPDTAFIATAPDWVCEILSPSTVRVDRTDKLAVYASHHVSHAWYVDPIARTLEVMALTAGQWLLVAALKDNETVTAPPFEAHTFSLGSLWAVDEPR
ncbi:MAG: Uma2 family endonuclease [Proteobacteria bacterium]|nr:Uma2 family endonuclease [Pseudomonadota bacterium]